MRKGRDGEWKMEKNGMKKKIASTSDKVDSALRLADVTTPEPDLARKSFTF